jgi:hypothetical protein
MSRLDAATLVMARVVREIPCCVTVAATDSYRWMINPDVVAVRSIDLFVKDAM